MEVEDKKKALYVLNLIPGLGNLITSGFDSFSIPLFIWLAIALVGLQKNLFLSWLVCYVTLNLAGAAALNKRPEKHKQKRQDAVYRDSRPARAINEEKQEKQEKRKQMSAEDGQKIQVQKKQQQERVAQQQQDRLAQKQKPKAKQEEQDVPFSYLTPDLKSYNPTEISTSSAVPYKFAMDEAQRVETQFVQPVEAPQTAPYLSGVKFEVCPDCKTPCDHGFSFCPQCARMLV